MKYWVPESWSTSFDHEGLLFFVQRIQEMLFHFSDDIYRAPVHNTSSLIQEYLSVHKDVKNRSIGAYHLTPIYDELKESLQHDKILYAYLGERYVKSLFDQLQSCPDSNKYNFVNYLSGLIQPFYLKWTISYLKKHIPHGNHKAEIESGTRAWVSDQIMRGYTSEYIYSYTEQFFIQGSIDSLDVANTFFDRFDFSKRNYKVYMQLSDSMAPYFDTLETRITLSFKDDGNFSLIQQRKKRVICYLEIEALDYYKAVSYAYERINIFIKYYQFISNKRSHLLHKFCAVWDCEHERIYHLPITPTGFKAIETHSSVISAELIDNTILGMQIHGKSGHSTFDKAIALHNSALQQQLPKDGFVNLWSILEVFCPQGDASSKIEPILYAILPVLQKDYFTTIFSTIIKDLSENLTEPDYLDLVQQLNSTENLSKIAAFCLLPEYEQLREDIFAKLDNQPLLRNKIFSLYALRNNKKELFALTKRYKQRVKWHLYRLYRARNTIVHTGSVPGRIQVLGEHLHSYVDCVMFEIAFKLGTNNALQSINNLFVDTILLMNSKEEHFGNGGTVESTDIDILFKQNFCPEFHDN